jgi:hypothetical protein
VAKASDDLITHEFWLLAYVLAFVMDAGGLTAPEAENLLLDYANTGWFDDFKWHAAGPEIIHDLLDDVLPDASPSLPPGPLRPRQWGLRDFNFGTEVLVEWPHSRVVHRLSNPPAFARARELNELLVPFGAPHDGYTMHLVCLRGVDVISMSRHVGLISREQETALLRAMGYLPPEPEYVTYGMPKPKSPKQVAIQAFVISRYGANWRTVEVPLMQEAGGEDEEFSKAVPPTTERSTWRRALGLKPD